jgi:hypothetical protein
MPCHPHGPLPAPPSKTPRLTADRSLSVNAVHPVHRTGVAGWWVLGQLRRRDGVGTHGVGRRDWRGIVCGIVRV